MKSILLVDDEQQAIDVFKAALVEGGDEVVVAKDGKTALMMIKQQPFDLVVLDEMMPDMSGNDVIKALKADEQTKNIPIIILTNYNDDELVKTALSGGANDYVLKYKMVPEGLAEKVRSLIGE